MIDGNDVDHLFIFNLSLCVIVGPVCSYADVRVKDFNRLNIIFLFCLCRGERRYILWHGTFVVSFFDGA